MAMAACETRANASERPPTYYTALQAHLTDWHSPAMAGSGAGDGNRTHGKNTKCLSKSDGCEHD
jgi:hypothetical protein